MSNEWRRCPFLCELRDLEIDETSKVIGYMCKGECHACKAHRPAEDALKAENAELRYIVNEFKEWYNENGCPKYFDSDFPCSAETEYKNDPETEGDFDARDCWKQEHEAGCWVEYYRWKYKQEKEKGCKDDEK